MARAAEGSEANVGNRPLKCWQWLHRLPVVWGFRSRAATAVIRTRAGASFRRLGFWAAIEWGWLYDERRKSEGCCSFH